MVKAVFQVPGMERVLGNPGTVGRVFLAKFGVNFDMYTDELGLPGYWPTSLIVTVSTGSLEHMGVADPFGTARCMSSGRVALGVRLRTGAPKFLLSCDTAWQIGTVR